VAALSRHVRGCGLLGLRCWYHGLLDDWVYAMSQRNSEYARIDGDTYVTPRWVYDVLFANEKFVDAWDCAPVDGAFDFLQRQEPCDEIATNPPYGRLAEPFVRHALTLTQESGGKVAMLLPHAWDTAKGRIDLFQQPPFKAKLVLTRRIRWDNLEQKDNGPSSNHAWYIWDWDFSGTAFTRWI
jgi:hypothetical protein